MAIRIANLKQPLKKTKKAKQSRSNITLELKSIIWRKMTPERQKFEYIRLEANLGDLHGKIVRDPSLFSIISRKVRWMLLDHLADWDFTSLELWSDCPPD